MPSRLVFTLGLLILLVPTALRIYLLQPFPGSQELESIAFAYRLVPWVLPLQIVGGVVALVGLVSIFRGPWRRRTLISVGLALLLTAAIFYASVALNAAKMFQPFETIAFAQGTSEELPPETLVMGIVSGADARAYPLRLLAYHHRLEDELDGEPIWVTYCTMCRTGKIFRPVVDGQHLSFDLLGAVRYNSIYEDRETGTWWYQANGRAAVGPLAGEVLPELYSDQMTLERWLELHPESQVLQPDPAAAEGYTMFNFDKIDEKRSNPKLAPGWQWVLGVVHGDAARAYPWALLSEKRLIEDEIAGLPVAVHLHDDLISYRVWDRQLDGRVLDLELSEEGDLLVDAASGSSFGYDGVARGGELEGLELEPVQATLEYWHSFEYFSGGELYEAP